jgi:hypothetical protein
MTRLTYCLITHTSYIDILHIYLHTNKRNLSFLPITIAINDKQWLLDTYGSEFSFQNVIEYDDTLLYGARMKFILEQIDTEYVLVNHDSNVVVEPVQEQFIHQAIAHMDTHGVDQLRLSDSGISNVDYDDQPFHRLNPETDYIFSAMTSMWRRTSLLALYTRFHDHTMRCIECAPIQQYTAKLNSWYCSSKKDIVQLPLMHSILYWFPTVHVTHLGKWTTQAHGNRKYIEALSKEFEIDLNVRGMM